MLSLLYRKDKKHFCVKKDVSYIGGQEATTNPYVYSISLWNSTVIILAERKKTTQENWTAK